MLYNGVLLLISSQFIIQRYQAGGLKWTMVGNFVPRKLANATNQAFFPHRLLNISSVLHNSQSQKQTSPQYFYTVYPNRMIL